MTSSSPLPLPAGGVAASSDVVAAGLPVPPIERLRIFSASQWEDFVLEWADSLRDQYGTVERCGGAGDMGRDIIAFDKTDPAIWDNFQCKHYKAGLTPGDIWVELGKLVYYSFIKEYTYPRKYVFVAPQGAGTKLSNLLRKPDNLKSQLIENWDKRCKAEITSTADIELDPDLRAYLDALDFSIFQAVPPLRIIDQHAKTRWYAARFGGGLPARPKLAPPPATITDDEVTYVRSLLDAYGDHLKCAVPTVADLEAHDDAREHFNDARLEFYSAEALRAFSRDILPPGAFEELQEELHGGIKDEMRGEHSDGFRRVLAVVKTAKLLPITDHALKERLSLIDKGGICHQLANNGKVRWVR
ncbi:ABC-three component system protein [Rhodanobacter sp. UC4451_H18]